MPTLEMLHTPSGRRVPRPDLMLVHRPAQPVLWIIDQNMKRLWDAWRIEQWIQVADGQILTDEDSEFLIVLDGKTYAYDQTQFLSMPWKDILQIRFPDNIPPHEWRQ